MGNQSFDIYFLDYNIAVEYHGIQHFKPVDFFGGDDSFISNRERDIRKNNLSKENNCKLFYFTYKEKEIFDYPYYVEYSEEKLFKDIKNEIDLVKKESV